MIDANCKLLFQGDSITDAGRIREQSDHLGQGYAMMIAAWFTALYPHMNVTFLNRGISGNRTCDLVERWDRDCLDLKPDVVSILIGINDTWRAVDQKMLTSPGQFEKNYRHLLQKTVDKLDARLIVLEPFLLPNQACYSEMRKDLNPKIEVARALAREFSTVFVPLDGMFQAACSRVPAEIWSGDGIHLTPAGNALLAQAWLEEVLA